MNILPVDIDTDESKCEWKQLCLGVDDFYSHRDIIEDIWPKLVNYLKKKRKLDISGPNEIPWFHLRRANNENEKDETKMISPKRYEVLRIRNGYLSKDEYEELLSLGATSVDVKSCGWWPQPFAPHHDNAFLSFLQKLSILRTIENIFISECLAIVNNRYDICPHVQRAYDVMMRDNQPWTKYLMPWFEYMKKATMEKNKTHEYAHWFGHILSGWPINI